MDGVSTYLALTFGTLLSSQGTDASFVLTLSGFPPVRFPSVFPFPTLSDLCDPISSVLSRSTLFASPFPADPPLSEDLGRIFHPARDWHRRAKQSGSRSGGAVNVLERGAPMQIEAPDRKSTRLNSSHVK